MFFTQDQQRIMRMFAIFCGVYFNGVWMQSTESQIDDICYVIALSFAVHLAFT